MVKENKAQVVFNQYLRKKRMHGFFELKVAKGKNFFFSDIEEHQLAGLQATEKEGLVWKLSDEDRRKKPCDTLCIPPLPSFLVVQFDRTFYMIRIQMVMMLIESGQKSLDVDECKYASSKVVHT